MKIVVLVAVLGASAPLVEAAQARRPAPPPPAQAPDRLAQAYDQFMRAHTLEEDDVEGAIAAYRRAMTLDPTASAIPADLADLLMREGRANEAIEAAEQALRISADDMDAHRVLGTVYATLGSAPEGPRLTRAAQRENFAKAIDHLEKAFAQQVGTADANLRAMLARLYMAVESYEKAIPILTDLVKQEPGWQDGPTLLTEAYTAAGRGADAVKWLEESAPDNPQLYATLGDYYVRSRRYGDAAGAYEQALKNGAARSADIRVRLASALINVGEREDYERARVVLREALEMRQNDEALYLLAQAEMGLEDAAGAEATARRLIARNARNANGYYALALALDAQRRYQSIVDALAPALPNFRTGNNSAMALGMLLPHLGFAYLQLGQYDKAIGAFEEAQKSSPGNPAFTGYLIQAQIAAKNYTAAADLARAARVQRPTDLRLARLESQALRRGGKVDQGLAVLEEFTRAQSGDVDAHIALAQAYLDANRGSQAVRVLRDAQTRFPNETSVTFELGAALDKQKRYAESEAIFRQLIEKDPENAIALNYLGYMLAERGERLGESVDFLKRALAIDPDNGSYLDSIGWAYFKDGQLDLALQNLQRAAAQLANNSVVQDHYGDVLFKLGRYTDAIEAWNRALSGDLDSVDRGEVDKKIRSARQKLPRR